MSLTTGDRLGPYEVTAPIGAGGMGEVYRATDTKLDRDVAIKVLSDAFSSDPERLARFEREAKVLASLNHPGIAAIYGLETSGATRALILELVEGPTLQDRIAHGPIPLDDALPIATQIAEALEAAHEHGIIHRDLKPANIKVTPDGVVKLLDFGLAKALEPEMPEADAANSPTLTAAATTKGVILGTAAYMSPEQARGGVADRRADVWSFGVVLYEMLTGRQLFTGASVSDTLAAVLKTEPDWSTLPSTTPPLLRRLLRHCLEKDRKERLQHIGDVRVELRDARTGSDGDAATAPVAQPARWQRPLFVTAALVFGLIVGGLAVWILTRPAPAPPSPVTRMSIVLPPTQQQTSLLRRGVAISPTGTHVVYAANRQLYLRALDELEAQPLPGTEGSEPSSLFFSPDGEWIGFYSGRDGALQKVALAGGAAVTLAEVSGINGASWGADDTIVFGQLGRGIGRGILRVAGAGGTPEVLVSDDETAFRYVLPQMLPGGEVVLYTRTTPSGAVGSSGEWDAAQIVVEQVATGERTVVIEGGYDARYLPTGHLVYALGGTLLAVPFDVDRLEVTGSPVPLVEGISRATTGAANADIARTGTLVYLLGEGTGEEVRTLVWVDRDGTEEVLAAPPRAYVYPRLSPDGTRVVLDARDEEDDLWVWDLTRETLTRLTSAAEADRFGVWTPDGQRVVFASLRDGGNINLYWRAADGTGAVERLTESSRPHFPQTFSPDGTRLVLYSATPDTRNDLHVLTLDADRRVAPLIVTEFREMSADLSPDGQWLAYQSNASGRWEVYVQPFPDVDGGRWQISTTGGMRPLWGPDGQELFYLTDAGVMGVTVEIGAGFGVGTPTLVIAGSYFGPPVGTVSGRIYDIAPDGQRFLMLKESGTATADDPFAGLMQIHVVQNWFEELKARVPTGQ